MKNAPRVAFIGLSDRVSKDRNIDPNLALWNFLGLRTEVVSFLYPLRLEPYKLVFSVFDIGSIGDFSVNIINDGKQFLKLDLNFESTHDENIPIDPLHVSQLRVPNETSWTMFTFRFPNDAIIFVPGKYDLFIQQNESEEQIGSIYFYYAPAPPLTREKIDAIRSNPKGIEFIRIILTCKKCSSPLLIYTGLERSQKLEDEGKPVV